MKCDVVRKSKLAALFGCALLFAACDSSAPVDNSPEAQVTRRSTEMLDALLAADFDKALSYANSYYRMTTTPSQYRSRYGGVGSWTKAQVTSAVCEAERCRVRVLLTYRTLQNVETTRPLDEVWIALDGQWYLFEG